MKSFSTSKINPKIRSRAASITQKQFFLQTTSVIKTRNFSVKNNQFSTHTLPFYQQTTSIFAVNQVQPIKLYKRNITNEVVTNEETQIANNEINIETEKINTNIESTNTTTPTTNEISIDIAAPLSSTPSPTQTPPIDELTEESLNELLQGIQTAKEGGIAEIIEKTWQWYDPILNFCIGVITSVHDITGLPWWGSLIAVGFSMRLLTFPLNLISTQNSSRLANIRETMTQISEKRAGLKPGATREERTQRTLEMRKEMKELQKANGISYWKIFLPALCQIPIMVSFYASIRRMCYSTDYYDFMQGGALWFTDLTSNDPFFLLPTITGALFLSATEVQRIINERNGIPPNKFTKIMTYFFRGLFLFMIPVTALLPVGIHFYWIGTGAFGVILPGIWRNKFFQKIFNLPSNAGLQGRPTIIQEKPEVLTSKPKTWKSKSAPETSV